SRIARPPVRLSQADARQLCAVVTPARNGIAWDRGADCVYLVDTELGGRRCAVLLEVGAALGAGNRHHVWPAGEQPCQRKLCGGKPALGGALGERIDQLQVALQVPDTKARMEGAHIARGGRERRIDASCQQAATERAVGDETDAQLATGREDLVLGVAREDRVLALQRADRMDRVSSPQRGSRALGQTEEAHLARLN